MTDHQPLSDNRSTRRSRVSEICQVDLAWQRKREQYLEFGREPRPLDGRSLLLIMVFFTMSWGLAAWKGLEHLVPAIALTTISSFASLRSRSFDRAYQQYRQRLAEATVVAGR